MGGSVWVHTHIICDNNVTNLTLIRHKWEQFYFIMQILLGKTKKKKKKDKPTVSHKICHTFGQMLQQYWHYYNKRIRHGSQPTKASHMGQITTTTTGAVINPFAESKVAWKHLPHKLRGRQRKHPDSHRHPRLRDTLLPHRHTYSLPAFTHSFPIVSPRLDLMRCKLTLGTAEGASKRSKLAQLSMEKDTWSPSHKVMNVQLPVERPKL